MKNNTLYIQRFKRTKDENPIRSHLHTESFKCSSKDGALDILAKRNKENIKIAIYTDQTGKNHKLINKK